MIIPDVNVPPVSNGDNVPPAVPPITTPPVTTPPAPGSKTDPALLLQAVQDERKKRQEAEDEIKRLQDVISSGDSSNEEVRGMKGQIDELKSTIHGLTRTNELTKLEVKFPALKDKGTEFTSYLNDPQNAGMSLETAAKAFLIDNNLMDTPPIRKGMEAPSGGGRQAAPQGLTFAEISEVRKNNPRKYSQMLREGKLNDIQN